MAKPSMEDLANMRAAALQSALDGDLDTARKIKAVADMVTEDSGENADK